MFNLVLKLIIQLLTVIIFAPLLNGIIKKIKALSQHRKGAPVLQLYFDIIKLFKKDVVIPENSSWIFRVTPYIVLISLLIAAVFVPVIPQLFSFSFIGDAILLVYIFAAGRFFIVLSGLDTGSTFGGMGSSREMMISSLVEPSFIITVFTLGLTVNSTNLRDIYEGSVHTNVGVITPVFILLLSAMMIILLAETARIPVDDPATHLELTMVHEAMILEYSGRYLAFIELSSAIKQLVLITLIVNVFLPFGSSGGMGWSLLITFVLYVIKVIIVTVVVAIIEINSLKLRLFSVPNLAALSFILSLLGFMSSFVFGRL